VMKTAKTKIIRVIIPRPLPPPKELCWSGGSTPIGVAWYVAVHFVASEIEA